MDPQPTRDPANDEATPRIVVVGASSGGIEALLVLLGALPADLPASIVVAQHIDPQRLSHLGEVLGARTTLRVRSVADREPLQPGVVYVAPADRDLEVTAREVVARVPEGAASKPSVDRLLTSAAHVFSDDLIAVVLSGTGTDGAIGAQAVKAHGGIVVVQNPETAEYAGMPRAVNPSAVDIVADVEAIGPLLVDLIGGDFVVQSDDDELRSFLARVRERSGVDFGAYKPPTIVRRLQRRMAAVGASTLTDYRRYVERHPEELQRLVAAFLIKVTDFFRDPDLFAYLREQVLPALIDDARAQGELRLWSAGCATGEDAN
jgi:two-component system CheB/CheR fusion protein